MHQMISISVLILQQNLSYGKEVVSKECNYRHTWLLNTDIHVIQILSVVIVMIIMQLRFIMIKEDVFAGKKIILIVLTVGIQGTIVMIKDVLIHLHTT